MGWQEAKKAAWQQFGRRYWKAIVGVEMARRYGPGLLAALTVGALAAGVWWLVTHLPDLPAAAGVVDVPGRWWYWPVGGVAALTAVLLLRQRDPLAGPLRYRPAALARRVVAALAVAGAALLLIVWREA